MKDIFQAEIQNISDLGRSRPMPETVRNSQASMDIGLQSTVRLSAWSLLSSKVFQSMLQKRHVMFFTLYLRQVSVRRCITSFVAMHFTWGCQSWPGILV